MNGIAFRCRAACARRWAIASGLALALAFAHATALARPVFVVNLPWALPAVKGKTTEAFMLLQSSEGAALVGVQCPYAASVAIIGPEAKKSLARLSLPPGKPILLAPGKYRLRLAHIDRTLKLGDHVPLELTIETADGARQTVAVDMEVRRRSAFDDEAHEHHQH
jgi:periplasmic copper chaperone A